MRLGHSFRLSGVAGSFIRPGSQFHKRQADTRMNAVGHFVQGSDMVEKRPGVEHAFIIQRFDRDVFFAELTSHLQLPSTGATNT